MKETGKQRMSWRLTSLLVAMLVLITMSEQVASQSSQPTDRNSTLIRHYCSQYRGISEKYFLINLNTTLSSLRHQLMSSGYAAARTLLNGESVWGLAWCRGYLSTPDCLSCFDYAVNQLKVCGSVNGAHAIYSDCDVRYENNNFYTEANSGAGVVSCDNIRSPQPTEFQKAAEKLLLDLQIAAPRAPKYYALSTRKVADGSARTPFFGLNQTTDISHLLWKGDSNKKGSIIGGVVGGVSFLLLILAIFLWYRRSKRMGRDYQDKSTGSIELLQGPSAYNYNDLKKATNNFSNENRLGGGIFGEVYKGTLKDGDMVAIKRTFMASSRGKRHFNNELKIISNVHHRHIVRLLGYCSKGPHLFLVHEYMENRSLDQFLYGDKTRTLNWKQMFDIIYGIARGLAYLHEQYHVTIIHRDIKTSNILLDNEFQPKISDFGLIRLLPDEKTHLSTKLAGSKNNGYVAPEYAIHGQLSEKVDTYSFGIVVLEIISGKRYNDVKDEKSVNQNLLDLTWDLYDSGTHLNIIDEKLDPSEYAVEDAVKIIEIALMCTQSPVSARPSMSEVVTLLSDKSLDDKPQPVRSTVSDDEVKIHISTMESSTSIATESTNQLSGR